MGWTNSDYGYIYHLAGSHHTPEEAHRVLSESLATRKMAIREYELAKKQREVDRAKIQRKLDKCTDDLKRADLLLKMEKIGIHSEVEENDYKLAVHEVEFITEAMSRLEPHCNWVALKDTDTPITREQGYQLAQQAERRMVLLERARIGLLANRAIDSETIREAKSHPQMEQIEKEMVAMLKLAKEGKLRLVHTTPMLLLSGKQPEHTPIPWTLVQSDRR